MQHLVVQTARPDGLQADDWVVNGVNRKGICLLKFAVHATVQTQ